MKSEASRQRMLDHGVRHHDLASNGRNLNKKNRFFDNLANPQLSEIFYKTRDDANLRYLAARIENYEQLTEARLEAISRAIEAREGATIAVVANSLSDAVARIGAIGLMKLAILLEMLGKNDRIDEARKVFCELEKAYREFKQNLISEWS